jgi:hypothetical protein
MEPIIDPVRITVRDMATATVLYDWDAEMDVPQVEKHAAARNSRR